MNTEALREHLARAGTASSAAATIGGNPAAAASRGRMDRIVHQARSRLAYARGRLRALPLEVLAGISRSPHVILGVPRFDGELELDVRSHLFRRLVNGFERRLADLVSRLVTSGDDVIDVGANIGLFSVLCGKRAAPGRVLAIEPGPAAIALLQRNLARNQLDNVIVFPGAASDHDRGVVLHHEAIHTEYASIGGVHHPNAPQRGNRELSVPSQTLDRLVAEHELAPAFVKIDVEGAEGLVLRGARDVVRDHRPVILSELDDRLLAPLGDSSEGILEMVRGAGYTCFDANTGVRLEPARESNRGPGFIGEILAVPEEIAP